MGLNLFWTSMEGRQCSNFGQLEEPRMTMKVNKGPPKVLLIGPFWFHNLTHNSLAFKKFPIWAYEMSYSCLVNTFRERIVP